MAKARVLELPTIADPIEALLRLYRGLRSLWDFLEEGQREVERYNGGRPVCMARCGLCCSRSTPIVSVLEAGYLVSHLQYLDGREPVKEAALAWVKTANPRLKAQGVPYGRSLDGEHLAALQADNLVLQSSPCPFLTEEMECRVHAARPLICRAYGVTLPPDEWCPRPLTGMETPNGRMLVGRDTPLGMKIAGCLIGLWEVMRYMKRDDLAVVGLLPMLVAEALALAEVKRLRDGGLMQSAKMGKGRWVKPDLFGEQRYAGMLLTLRPSGLALGMGRGEGDKETAGG